MFRPQFLWRITIEIPLGTGTSDRIYAILENPYPDDVAKLSTLLINKYGLTFDPSTYTFIIRNRTKFAYMIDEFVMLLQRYNFKVYYKTEDQPSKELSYDELKRLLEEKFEQHQKYVKVKFEGNYVRVYYVTQDYVKLDKVLCYDYTYYDRELGELKTEKRCLYYELDNAIRFPRGLLFRFLYTFGLKPSTYFRDFDVSIPPHIAERLRPYQINVINALFEMLKIQGAGTVMIATGGGKTYMAGAIVKALMEKGVVSRVFFLANSIDLILQAYDFFLKWGFGKDKVGIVTGEKKEIGKPITCCTVQTLARALSKVEGETELDNSYVDEELAAYMDVVELTSKEQEALVEHYKKADLVIVDEAHHVPAKTYKFVVKSNPNSMRIGLTATPWRNDFKDLEIYAYSGDVVPYIVTSSMLIRQGYLVPAKIIMYKRKATIPKWVWRELGSDYDLSPALRGLRAYHAVKRYLFLKDEQRLNEIIEIARLLPKPLLILTKEVKPAELIYERIIDKVTDKAKLVTGVVKGKTRAEILEMVRQKKIDVLVATTLADEGLDIPALRSLLITAGGKSKTRTLQRVGRVVRPYEGKKYAVVVDIWDDAPYFGKHGSERMALYKYEDAWEVKVVESFEDVLKILSEIE